MAFDLVGKAVKNLRLPTVNYSSSTVAIIPAQENDTNSRYLRVTLYDDRGDISLENYTGISLNATLPDGSFQVADGGEIDRENNVVICKIASSLLTQPGKVSCDILLSGRDNNGIDTALTSQTFYLLVNKNQVNDEAIEASDELPIVAQLLCEMSEIRKETADVFETTERQQGEIRDVESGLANLASGVEKNSKRITNLEQGLMPDPFEVDDAVAYAKTVPEGALPYAEVAKVGGMSYKSANRIPYPYAETTKTANGITFTDNGDGSITINGTCTEGISFAFGRFQVTPGKDYFLKVIPISGGFDSIYAYIYTGDGADEAYDLGDGAKFTPNGAYAFSTMVVRPGQTFDNLVIRPMLNEGTTTKPYSPYFEGLRHAKATAVKSIGSNVSPISTPQSGYFYDSTGEQSSADEGSICFYVNEVQGQTTYSVSSNLTLYSVWFDDGAKPISKTNATTFTTPIGCKRLRVSLNNTSGSAGTSAFEWFMINIGSTALPYSPFGTLGTLPIPSAVQALPDYGLGVSATVNNHIDLSERKYRHPCSKVDLGTLYWGESTGGVWYTEGLVGIAMPNVGVCDKYTVIPTTAAELAEDKTLQIRDNIAYLKDLSITDTSQITGTLVYALATPDEPTDISHLIPKDNFIPVEAGGQIVAENEYKLAAPTEIVYQIKEATA